VNRGPLAEIDLAALQNNLNIIYRAVGKRNVISVVKADAYGHGAVTISRELVDAGVSYLAVAFTEEAKVLRDAGITAQIMVLFDNRDVTDFFTYDLIPVIYEKRTARAFAGEAAKKGRSVSVHLKIDTGMGRVGFSADTAVSDALDIAAMKGIAVEGLLSHFSDADLSDKSYARDQLELFQRIKGDISAGLGYPLMTHMANSAAILTLQESYLDAVRPGIMLYGCSPFGESYGLRPVMKIKSEVLAIRSLPPGSPISYGRTYVTRRKSRIAVIPVGYADGYNRLFSNNSDVLIRGKRAPVVGRICMDVTMVDVTDIHDVSENDEVVLLGRQMDELITARELSDRINTIPYEIVTAFGHGSRREYV
jgi:alanine racemase